MNCIYIHGKHFVDAILNGEKTMETRNSNTLDRFLCQTVGIILTGCGKPKLIGTVKITGAWLLDYWDFRAYENQHLVQPGSRYDIGTRPLKVGYTLANPKRLETPIELEPVKGNRIWREV